MSKVFIIFQKTEESRCIVEAVLEDNPDAVLNEQPGMVRIETDDRLVIRRATIEEKIGRDFDLQEMQIYLISLTGHIDETDDEFTLSWD